MFEPACRQAGFPKISKMVTKNHFNLQSDFKGIEVGRMFNSDYR